MHDQKVVLQAGKNFLFYFVQTYLRSFVLILLEFLYQFMVSVYGIQISAEGIDFTKGVQFEVIP